MKAHVGVDAASGVTPSLETSPAKVHDSRIWDELRHGEETSVWANEGYRTRDVARADVFDYIQRFYNPTRRRSKLCEPNPVSTKPAAGQAAISAQPNALIRRSIE